MAGNVALVNHFFGPPFPQAMLSLPKMTWMPDINIASGGGGKRNTLFLRVYCLPRVLARVVDADRRRNSYTWGEATTGPGQWWMEGAYWWPLPQMGLQAMMMMKCGYVVSICQSITTGNVSKLLPATLTFKHFKQSVANYTCISTFQVPSLDLLCTYILRKKTLDSVLSALGIRGSSRREIICSQTSLSSFSIWSLNFLLSSLFFSSFPSAFASNEETIRHAALLAPITFL